VATVAFLVADEGIEQVELTQPWKDVQDAGATPVLVSTTDGQVQGFDHLDKADTFEVDRTVGDVSVDDFDLLLLPGGVANPDALRLDEQAVALVSAALEKGRPSRRSATPRGCSSRPTGSAAGPSPRGRA
jgi:protease I